MQIHLRLSKAEFQALLEVARAIAKGAAEAEDFEEFQVWDSMRELAMDMMRRVPELKDKNNVTLKDSAALTIWTVVDPLELPVYEGGVMMKLQAEIDRQWKSKKTMLDGNMRSRAVLEGGGR